MLESFLQKARSANPSDYDTLWRTARVTYFRSRIEERSNNHDTARACLEKGAQISAEAIKADRAGVEGWFWLGMNEIELAKRAGKLAALGAWKKAQEHLETAARIDESYYFAGPLRELGHITHRKPLLLGGSAGVAMEFFKRALQIAPENSTTKLFYAEALLTEQQKAQARHLLHEIVEEEEHPEWVWEQARDKEIAKELLAKM